MMSSWEAKQKRIATDCTSIMTFFAVLMKVREKDQRMGMRSKTSRIQEWMRSSTDNDKRRIKQRYNRRDLEEMDCITMDTTRNAAVMTLMTI